MAADHTKQLTKLEASLNPVEPEDRMAEAGRKVMLRHFVVMLKHEAGSRTGEDIEDVHDMRVSIRRMRSVIKLVRDDFKKEPLRTYDRDLREVMRALGAVRDLDVLLENMVVFGATLDEDTARSLQPIIEKWEAQRDAARESLLNLLDSKGYRKFVKGFGKFLRRSGEAVREVDDAITPHQVRHVLPVLIYEQLSNVRAYDTALQVEQMSDVPYETLHALRIEFKALRYLVSLFSEVLGPELDDFIVELKKIQDHLGRLNDIAVAQERFSGLKLDDHNGAVGAVEAYLEGLAAEAEELRETFPAVWNRFNTKTVQRKLALAVASLK